MKHRKIITVAVALMLMATVVPAPAIAQENDSDDFSPIDDILAVDNDDSGFTADAKRTLSGIFGGLDGLSERVSHNAKSAVGMSEEWTAEGKAQTIQDQFNENNETYLSYVNNQTVGSENYDVFRISLHKQDTNETIYLVSTVENGTYTNATMVDSTNRTADHYVELCGLAAKDAPSEMTSFRSSFIEGNSTVSYGYAAKLTSKYKGQVGSDMLNGSKTCEA